MAQDNQVLKELAKRYSLTGNDFFKHQYQNFVIITRTGIEKIMHVDSIDVDYEIIQLSDDQKNVVIKATSTRKIVDEEAGDIRTVRAISFGSANPLNAPEKAKRDGTILPHYPVETAEKRAMARSVLKLTGFYKEGVFSEDESDDFKKNAK